jgi:hypothetical protein
MMWPGHSCLEQSAGYSPAVARWKKMRNLKAPQFVLRPSYFVLVGTSG